MKHISEPSIAIMETLPAEVLHFINDLEDEIERLWSRVQVLERHMGSDKIAILYDGQSYSIDDHLKIKA
jgi:hypothetical protein